MRTESVEWSFHRPPEFMIEFWAVEATLETILRIRVSDRKDIVETFLQGLQK